MAIKYKRILLKLSGEALLGNNTVGIDDTILHEYLKQVKEIIDLGVEVGLVIGGGNFFRGVSGTKVGIDRVSGDYMGMLATVMNGLAISSAFRQLGGKVKLLTAVNMGPVGERYAIEKALEALTNKELVVFTFGTGNPYFTTDTAASLRGVEIGAEVLLKGTRVDGVYTADPEKDKNAVKYNTLSFNEAMEKGLKIMDQTAFAMCRENNLPIVVFNMNKKGTLLKIIQSGNTGTLVAR